MPTHTESTRCSETVDCHPATALLLRFIIPTPGHIPSEGRPWARLPLPTLSCIYDVPAVNTGAVLSPPPLSRTFPPCVLFQQPLG